MEPKKATTTSVQSGPRSNDYDRELHTPQISRTVA